MDDYGRKGEGTMEHGFKVVTKTARRQDGTIVQEVYSERDDVRELILRQVMATQDEEIRKALIALGWTPPPDRA